MDLSSFLVREFANLYSKDNKSDGTYAYGTVNLSSGKQCVTIDGSSIQTPVISSIDLKDGDRVMVLVKDHSATVMSNLTSPAVGNSSFSEYKGKVSVAFDELTAKYIAADEALIGRIESEYVKTSKLESDYITADSIAAQYVKTSKLESDYLRAKDIDATYAKISKLDSDYLKAKDIDATYAKISKLESDYVTADEIKTKYADIDLANVTQESVKNLFADISLLQDATIKDGYITGQLMGVTMSANQITAGKLDAGVIDVVNLNAESITFGTLKRKNIDNGVLEDISNALTTAEDAKSTAKKSIKKVDVEYSKNQSQSDPPTTGWQTNAPDWEEGYYIWQRTATTLSDGTVSYTTAQCITGIKGDKGDQGIQGKQGEQGVQGPPGEDAVMLYIDSSNGNVFKNSSIATTLTVTIIKGEQTANSSEEMYKMFGNSARLVWKCRQAGEISFSELDASDSRLSDNGFILTLNTDDINERAVFNCDLYL